MPIKSSDLQWWIPSSSNTRGRLAQSGVVNDLFPTMSGASNRDSVIDYHKAIILYNASNLTLTSAKVFFKVLDSGGATYRLAWDALGVVAGTGVPIIGDRPTSFAATYTSFSTGLALPASLGGGQAIGLWIQRQGQNFAAGRQPEKNTLTIQGTTPA